MNAIIEIGGKQLAVKENDIIDVDRINAEKGQTLSIKDVLAVGAGKDMKTGNPLVKGAEVKVEVIEHLRGDKVVVFKMKRRKGYKRKQGHRQELTKIKIQKISC
ncbi:MAG TPA: 50S ribosomal protein L21 [Victivallales bacterium]|nr:50S ribosomal protein L21 [Victivallales bacterium]